MRDWNDPRLARIIQLRLDARVSDLIHDHLPVRRYGTVLAVDEANDEATVRFPAGDGFDDVPHIALGFTAPAVGSRVPTMYWPETGDFYIDRDTELLAGEWIPALTLAVPGDLAVTYSTQLGRFRRMGDLCFWWLRLVTTSFVYSTASGQLSLTGLPFAPSTDFEWAGAGSFRGWTKVGFTTATPVVLPAGDMRWRMTGGGQAEPFMASGDIGSGATIAISASGSYPLA